MKKLGKKGYSHKSRILYISEEGISYYAMIENNKNTKNFLDSLNSLYTVLKNNTFDKNTFYQVVKYFKQIKPEEKKLKGFFSQYEIKSNEPISSFTKAPIRIYNVKANINRDDPENYWIMETKADCFRKAIKDAKKQIENYKKLKNKKKEKESEERKEEEKEFNQREIRKIELNDEKDKIHYIGILYQGFMKEYLNQIYKNNKNRIKSLERIEKEKREKEEREREQKLREEKEKLKSNQSFINTNSREDYLKEREEKEKEEQLKEERIKEEKARQIRINQNKLKDEKIKEDDAKHQLYLELAIYYCYNLFVKHCEKIVQKIINDLGTFEKPEDITIQKKLHPIVFPNPYYYSQENNSVLLYSVWGVNYTLTWNNLSAKFKNTFTQSKGKWKGLKYQFRQKNYFQDFLIKLSSICESTDDFPSIPMSCIIDFNGFRVYCESDIYANEEYLEGLKLQMAQNSLDKNDIYFVKELSKFISENNNDVKNEKIEISNVIVNISSKTISDDKNFDLESYINNVTNEYIKTFDKNIKNEVVGKNERNQIVQSVDQFIKCVKKIISENAVENDNENETFFQYVNQTLNKQPEMTFNYLMYFDVLIPQLNTEGVFYRQEIAINNIEFEKESGKREKDINLDNSSIDTGRKISGINSPKNFRSNILNYEDESSNNFNNNKEKEPWRIILNVVKKNTYQNNNEISNILEDKFKIKLDFLINALDSMYLIPYNSETLKISFHYYGINLHYLGKVAERTKVPHIRELCLIEMFARVCKKIIFDLLGQSTFTKAMNAFYLNIKELTTTLHRVPLSFNISYGSDYLKSITQPVERVKYLYYNGIEITGLYMQGDEYPLKENKDNKDKKDNFDNEINQMKFQPLSNFFSLLFRMSKTKLNLYGIEFTSTEELWNFIIENIKMRYDINNDDVFMYCKDDSISILALISAIQYHTGIKFQNGIAAILEKMGSQKFETAIFESVQPSCKNCYYNFTYFLCKENVALPLTNNFSLYYPGDLHYYQAKLNYYAEKYLYKKKISQNYYYLFYLKILKGWDTEKKTKSSSHQNQIKEFDKNITFTDNVPLQVSHIFEVHFDNFIALIISQYQPKTQNRLNKNEVIENNNKNDSNYLYTCETIIQRYWNMKHPFISLLKSTYAKALYKNSNSRKEEDKIDNNFLASVEIAKNSMGELNVFYGKLTRDVGLFFEKNFKFYNANQMFNIAYKVFNKHKRIFRKEYYYSLKYLTKTFVYLGRLKEGLYYGTILVKEMTEEKDLEYNDILHNNDVNNTFIEENKKMEYWEEIIHHMNSFTFNLMKIAEILGEYDIGVTLGNLFFKKIDNPINFILSPFKDWVDTSQKRVQEMINIKNDQNNKGENKLNTEIRVKEYGGSDKNIDSIIEVYLKCLFKSLKGIQHKTYTRAFVSFLDHCYCEELEKKNNEEINQLFYSLIFRKSNETFDQYFKNKLLYYILQKYKSENFAKEEVEESYKKAKRELLIMYYKFPKKDSKLFVNY